MTHKTAIQLCHGYKMPFFDVAQQHAYTLKQSGYRVITIFLTGKYDTDIENASFSDQTLFFEQSSKSLQGLKVNLIKKFNRICKDNQVSLIVAHRAKAIYLSCIASFLMPDIQIIGVAHAYNVFKRKKRRFMPYLRTKNLRLVGVSDAIRDDIRRSLPKFPQDQIQTYYNRLDFSSVEDTLLSREEARQALSIPEDEYAFINIGRLHPDKDQTTLIDGYSTALTNMPKSKLYIIGAGKIETQLKAHANASKASDCITFVGVVPDACKYLKAFDCFVLSSDHEPFGMVLLEAIAANIPMITTNCGGADEINRSDNKFNQGDSAALSTLLIQQRSRSQEDTKQQIREQHVFAEKTFSYAASVTRFSELEKIFKIKS